MAKLNQYNMDMCRGSLWRQILLYAWPLVLSYILQLTFHAADLVVIGNFASHESLAALGTTGGISALLINIFIGISTGANVLAAQYYGAKSFRNMSRVNHTSIAFAACSGAVVALTGILISRPMLELIDVPPEVMPLAHRYLCICFAGAPFLLVYNFGCAILRAVGDTRRPLYYLITAGVVNVLLNLFLVICCHWDVEGVAVATVVSQGISAYLVVQALRHNHGASRLLLRNLRLDLPILKRMLHIGVPAGIQGASFTLSNLLIQGAINSFGSVAMAGMTAAVSVEWILYSVCYAFHQTATAFAGQNYGGGEYKRVGKSMLICLLYVVLLNCIFPFLAIWQGRGLLAIFNPETDVINWGMIRIKTIFCWYFLVGAMDFASGGLRGLGKSVTPAVVSIMGACVFRIGWVLFVFPHFQSMENLLISYPISWFLTFSVNGLVLWHMCRKLTQMSPVKKTT